jgi:hypothetical protein
MVRTRQPEIERATDVVSHELRLIRRERDGFTQFLGRIQTIDVLNEKTNRSMGNGGMVLQGGQLAATNELQQVRTAYRETVMAMPHYEQEYDDTLEESLTVEFSAILANHVTNGQVLTQKLYDALLAGSEQARDQRDRFIRSLPQERDSLQNIAVRLDKIESRAARLSEQIAEASTSRQLKRIDDSLVRLRDRCTDCANQRQETIHNRRVSALSRLDERSLNRYLYHEMDTEFPALSDITDCIDTIRNQRRRCLN